MTTVYMEHGSHYPSGETYDDRDVYLRRLVERVGTYAGPVATASQLPAAESGPEA
jgi:hypothetical protein